MVSRELGASTTTSFGGRKGCSSSKVCVFGRRRDGATAVFDPVEDRRASSEFRRRELGFRQFCACLPLYLVRACLGGW